MSWQDYHDRANTLNAVLALAEHDPNPERLFVAVPRARATFGSAESMLHALAYRWRNLLAGRLEWAAWDHSRGDGADVGETWGLLAAEHPVLRSVLDAGTRKYPSLAATMAIERQMIDDFSDPFGRLNRQPTAPTPPQVVPETNPAA